MVDDIDRTRFATRNPAIVPMMIWNQELIDLIQAMIKK